MLLVRYDKLTVERTLNVMHSDTKQTLDISIVTDDLTNLTATGGRKRATLIEIKVATQSVILPR